MILKLKTAPAAEPVDISDIRSHLRIDTDADEALFKLYIAAARKMAEDLCGPLITQTWYQYQDAWPSDGHLLIGKPRLQTVTAVKYTPLTALVASTFAAANYTVDTKRENSPQIVLKDSCSWPGNELFNVNPVEIEFVCGYGDAWDSVPETIVLAIAFLVSHWYENRLPVVNVTGNMVEVPFGIEGLLGNYRWWGF